MTRKRSAGGPQFHMQTLVHTLLLCAVIAAAVLLRFGNLLQIEHNVDHAYSIGQALRTLARGDLPLVGQDTSLQFPNPALLGYLYLPLVALTRHVLGVYLPVIALNTLAVYLVYRLTRRTVSARAALAAAALMAVNPWIIEYSRSTWTHGLLPFLMCALAWRGWSLLMGTSRRPVRDTVLCALLVTVVTQVALLGYFVLPAVGLLLLIYWRRVPARGLLWGAAIFLLFNALFAAGLLQRLDVVGTQADAMLGASEGAYLRAEPFQHTARLVSGADYEINRGLQAPIQDAALRHTLTAPLTAVIHVLLAGGIALSLWRLRDPARRTQSVILLVWLLAPALAMAYNAALVHPFYLLVGLPAGYVLFGQAVELLLAPLRRAALPLLVAVLVPCGALLATNSLRYYQETRALPGAHDLTALSLEWGLRLGEHIDSHLPPGGVVFADVQEWILNSFAGDYFPVVNFTRARPRQGAYNEMQASIVPARGGLYIDAFAPDAPPLTALPFARRATVLELPDGWRITVDRYEPGGVPPGALAEVTYTETVPGERWISLVGYRFHRTADRLTLATYWRVDQVTPEAAGYSFAPFVHVMDGETTLAVVDGVPVRGAFWHPGDLHVHHMVFELPAGASAEDVRLLLGQYDATRQANITFILPDGTYTTRIPLRLAPDTCTGCGLE